MKVSKTGPSILLKGPSCMKTHFFDLEPEFLFHAEDEVLGSSGGGNNAVGNRLFQFRFRCTRVPRDREVFL